MAGHGISEGQLCKMDLPKGRLPAGLHLRFGGVQILHIRLPGARQPEAAAAADPQ